MMPAVRVICLLLIAHFAVVRARRFPAIFALGTEVCLSRKILGRHGLHHIPFIRNTREAARLHSSFESLRLTKVQIHIPRM